MFAPRPSFAPGPSPSFDPRIARELTRGASSLELLDALGLEPRAFLPWSNHDEAEPRCAAPLGAREVWLPLAPPSSPTFRRAVLRAACIAAASEAATGDAARVAPSGRFAFTEAALAAARELEAAHGLPAAPREGEAGRYCELLDAGRAYVRAALEGEGEARELAAGEVCA